MRRTANSLLPLAVLALSAGAIGLRARAVWAEDKPLATLEGHKASVHSLAYSPDGKTLASASADKTIRLWDTSTYQLRDTLEGHSDTVNCVAYSPDGKTLVSASADRTVTLWDTATGKPRATLQGHPSGVTCLAYSLDGKVLASASGTADGKGEIKLWNTTTNEERASLAATSGIGSLTFSPDAATLAAGCATEVQLWDVATAKERASPWNRFFGELKSVAYSPDGKTLATGGGFKNRPSQTVLWDVHTGKGQGILGDLTGVSSVAYRADGKLLAVWTLAYRGGGEIRLFDPTTGRVRQKFQVDGVWTAAFSPNHKRLATSDIGPIIKLWDVSDPQ